jgi:uncharacterized protein (TIGR03067 family)
MLNTVLALAVVVAAPAVKDPPKKDVPAIVGRWALSEVAVGPQKIPQVEMTVTFAADGSFESRDGGAVKKKGTYRTDPKKAPAEMDIQDGDGKEAMKPAIFKVEGDTLTIVAGTLGDARPTTFENRQDGGVIYMVFKRIKD